MLGPVLGTSLHFFAASRAESQSSPQGIQSSKFADYLLPQLIINLIFFKADTGTVAFGPLLTTVLQRESKIKRKKLRFCVAHFLLHYPFIRISILPYSNSVDSLCSLNMRSVAEVGTVKYLGTYLYDRKQRTLSVVETR